MILCDRHDAPPGGDAPPGQDPRDRLLGLLGLARRAGKLQLGFGAVEAMVQRGEKPLVIVAADMGPSQRRKVGNWEPVQGVLECGHSADVLGAALGRDKLAVVGLKDHAFVKGIRKLGF